MKNYSLLRVLAIRPFFFLWSAEILAQVSINIVNFVLLIIAFELTNSNTAVSIVVLSFTVPAILFGIPAGVYVDRWNKKQVLFATSVLRALALVLLAFAHSNLMLVYIITLVISIVTQFFLPAETPIIPLVVRKNLLLSANALFGMGIYGSILLAYALSGPLLIFFGKTSILLILSVLFLTAAGCVSFIKIPPKKPEGWNAEEQAPTFRQEIGNALSLMIKTHDISQSLFVLTLSQILILILAVIGPGYAKHILGIPVNTFPLLFVTPAALGMIIGAIIIGSFFHSFSRQRLANIGILLSGLAIVLLPYGSKVTARPFIQALNIFLPGSVLDINLLHIMIALAFLLGVANALTFVPSNTLIQEKTSDELRGKVYGALNALVGIFSIIPILAVGGLADLVGVGSVLTGIGVLLLLLSSVRFFHIR